MNKRIRVVVVALVVLALLYSGYRWWDQRNGAQGANLVLYGNVDIREVALAFRQPGRLLNMALEEGDSVKANQLVAEIDAKPYQDGLAGAVGDLLSARAELRKMQNGNRPPDIRRAEESVKEADAVFQKADSDFRRQRALAGDGIASARTFESVRAARDQAAAALGAARQTLELQREGFRKEDIDAAQARVQAADAARALAQTRLDDTRLTSPADAVVLARIREPGSMVGPLEPVYTLSLGSPVYIRAYASERHLGRVAPGTKVTVRTDSSDKIYEGQIGFVSPRAEFTPKSVETTDLRTDLVYRLRIVVSNPDQALRQGMPVTVLVDNGPDKAR